MNGMNAYPFIRIPFDSISFTKAILDLEDKFLTFNMTSINYEYTTFPFVNLKRNQMYAISNGHTCVSYPIIK